MVYGKMIGQTPCSTEHTGENKVYRVGLGCFRGCAASNSL